MEKAEPARELLDRLEWAVPMAKDRRVLILTNGEAGECGLIRAAAKSVTTATIWDLPKSGERFDLVLAFDVLETILPARTGALLFSMRELMANNAFLVILTRNRETIPAPTPTVLNLFSPIELRATLRLFFSQITMVGSYHERGFFGWSKRQSAVKKLKYSRLFWRTAEYTIAIGKAGGSLVS